MAYDPDWECYPLTARATGEKVDQTYTHEVDYKTVLKVNGVEKLTLRERSRLFSSDFHRLTIYDDPFIVNLDNGLGSGDVASYNPIQYQMSGAVSDDYQYVDTTLLFMDLRNDTIVYQQDRGALQASGTGSGPLEVSIDAGQAEFGEVGPHYDVVGVDISHTRTDDRNETVQLLDRAFEVTPDTTPDVDVTVRVGASDRSGFCGLVDRYYCLPWGSYGTVDLSLPHSTNHQPGGLEYTHLYDENPSVYPLEYLPHWTQFGDPAVNSADAELFAGLWAGNGVNSGDLPVDVPVNADPVGSWAEDRQANRLLSMTTRGGETFNILIDKDGTETNPVAIFGITGPLPKLYPIAPL